jgi:hypothetical protein
LQASGWSLRRGYRRPDSFHFSTGGRSFFPFHFFTFSLCGDQPSHFLRNIEHRRPQTDLCCAAHTVSLFSGFVQTMLLIAYHHDGKSSITVQISTNECHSIWIGILECNSPRD